MNTSCDSKTGFLNGCHPYITVACIISCLLCTVVMIWGVYAMRADMRSMETLMTSTPMKSTMMSSPEDDMIREHCRTMPEMAGCEKYR